MALFCDFQTPFFEHVSIKGVRVAIGKHYAKKSVLGPTFRTKCRKPKSGSEVLFGFDILTTEQAN